MRWPEISQGQLLLTLSPGARHQRVVHVVRTQLEPQLGPDLVLLTHTDLEVPELGALRVPDLAVVRADFRPSSADAVSPEDCTLIVEIVSHTHPANDYEGKVRDYPAMGIPHYLIVDPRNGTAVHHWAPAKRSGSPTYTDQRAYAFGDVFPVQGLKIDTAGLPRYDSGQPR